MEEERDEVEGEKGRPDGKRTDMMEREWGGARRDRGRGEVQKERTGW
jgi:hypothetical protein